jgi:hypothetical protein
MNIPTRLALGIWLKSVHRSLKYTRRHIVAILQSEPKVGIENLLATVSFQRPIQTLNIPLPGNRQLSS